MPGPLTHDPRSAASGGARDREAYFAAAYALLAEGGCEAVTVSALCRRLHASTGSFYHHFADVPAFVVAFADRWQQGMAAWIDDWVAVADPLRRHELITNQSLDFLFTDGESAIRAWAHTHPALGSALELVHRSAHEVTVGVYEQILGDPELARLLQALAMCTVMGLSLRAQGAPDPARYRRMCLEYGRRSVGIETELVEIDGRVQFRFVDGVQPDLPADPPWSPPDVHGLTWVDGDPPPEPVPPGSNGRTRNRADYFLAARELLAQKGSDGLTADALCRRLGVTKGSFHWHFEGMPAFVEVLAAHWEQRHETWLAAEVDGPDPVERLEKLFQRLLRAPDPAELAFRAWAHADPVVGAALRQIDGRSQEVFTATIRDATGDPAADVLADGMLGLAIGLHQNLPGVDPDLAARIVLVFARRYLRVDAELHVADNQPILAITRPTPLWCNLSRCDGSR